MFATWELGYISQDVLPPSWRTIRLAFGQHYSFYFTMVQLFNLLGLAAISVSLVIAAPAPVVTQAPDLAKRATCTFTNAASAIKSKAACATIILDNIFVPAGTTLDMTDLTE